MKLKCSVSRSASRVGIKLISQRIRLVSLKIHLKTTVFVTLGSKHSLLAAKKRVPNTFYQNSWTLYFLANVTDVRRNGPSVGDGFQLHYNTFGALQQQDGVMWN